VETSIKVSFLKANPMVTVNTTGKMEAISKAFSRWEDAKGKESGKSHQAIVISTKDSTSKIRKTATVSSPGTMATFIREVTNWMKDTVMARCIGWMEATTKEIGSWASRTDRVIFI
jgi:mannitol-specific phosphotransferase system IIBC component